MCLKGYKPKDCKAAIIKSILNSQNDSLQRTKCKQWIHRNKYEFKIEISINYCNEWGLIGNFLSIYRKKGDKAYGCKNFSIQRITRKKVRC